MPPSPTGYLHVGNLRTLLFNAIFAERYGGKTVLRIEDTDKARSKSEYEQYIIDTLDWLGITYEGPYRQSERTEVYARYLRTLIENDAAYVSEEHHTDEQIMQAKEEGKQLSDTVIRFRNKGGVVAFRDEILGEISHDVADLGDFVIAKDFENPLYHLTVVVDDYEMGITHVIRGNDHISNTPRQILIQEAIGAPRPLYAHLPLVVGSDGAKLSKRHGAVAALWYRDEGYLPETFLNFLMLIGWHPKDDQELMNHVDIAKVFGLDGIQKGSAVFDENKLRWLNKQRIQELSDEQFLEEIEKRYPELLCVRQEGKALLVQLIRERISVWSDLAKMREEGEFSFVHTAPSFPDPLVLVWKKSNKEDTKKYLGVLSERIVVSHGELSADSAKETVFPYAEEKGKGEVLWPLRYALSGKEKSPDPFSLMAILGREEVLARIRSAGTLL